MFKILVLALTVSIAFASEKVGKTSEGKKCTLQVESTRVENFYKRNSVANSTVKISSSNYFFFNKITATEFYLLKLERQNPEQARAMREYHRSGLVPPRGPEYHECAYVQLGATSSDVGPWGVSKIVLASLCLDEKFQEKWVWVSSDDLNLDEVCKF